MASFIANTISIQKTALAYQIIFWILLCDKDNDSFFLWRKKHFFQLNRESVLNKLSPKSSKKYPNDIVEDNQRRFQNTQNSRNS